MEALPNNLPLQLSSFVGRETEMDEIRRLLAGSRLLSLTGAGGCGKTRLALQVAADLLDLYRDGAWRVDLAPLGDPALVASTVAGQLSFREGAGQSPLHTLVDNLRERHTLIVLDNCEHLVEACAELVDALVRACPGVTVLATSQMPLGVEGEVLFRVPSLPVPEGRDRGTEALGEYDAVRLFVDRAAKSQPTFTLTQQNAPAVAQICRRLDGIPLAIELAAARVRALTPAGIAEGLGEGLRLLAGGVRTALPRQRTLEASVEWSHSLLDGVERTLLRRLSVFAGGFTIEAARAVCSDDGLEGEEVLDLLSLLVDRSLVQMDQLNGDARYWLLETIRHYARRRLDDAAETAATRDRHLLYCVELAERAEPELEGARQRFWLEHLEADLDNFRAALDWGVAGGHADAALRLAAALTFLWYVRGHFTEGEAMLTRVLQAGDASPSSRARALLGLGWLTGFGVGAGTDVALGMLTESAELARASGDTRTAARSLFTIGNVVELESPARALPRLEESVALARQASDSWCLAFALLHGGLCEFALGRVPAAMTSLDEALSLARAGRHLEILTEGLGHRGWVALRRGHHDSAAGFLDECLALARELGHEMWVPLGLQLSGELARLRGGYAAARDLATESLRYAERTENAPARAWGLGFLGWVAYASGDPVAARPAFEEAVARSNAAGYKRYLAWFLQGLGESAASLGDTTPARVRLDESLAVARETQAWDVGPAMYALALLARSTGDHDRADALVREALTLQLELGDVQGIADSLEAIGGLAVGSRIADAARLMGASESLREVIGYARLPVRHPRHDADVAVLRARLEASVLRAAWDEGRAMRPGEAAALALRV